MAAPAGGLEEAFGDVGEDVLAELADLTVQQIKNRTDMQKNNASAIKAEMRGVEQEVKNVEAEIKQNKERIKLNTQLPYLVANVVELLDVEADEDDGETESGAKVDSAVANTRGGSKACVVKGSNRQVRGAARDVAAAVRLDFQPPLTPPPTPSQTHHATVSLSLRARADFFPPDPRARQRVRAQAG